MRIKISLTEKATEPNGGGRARSARCHFGMRTELLMSNELPSDKPDRRDDAYLKNILRRDEAVERKAPKDGMRDV